MTAIVPDTLQGAFIVSVIDFFLSFLIISGIGCVLSLFPLLNRAARIVQRLRTVAAPVAIEAARDGKMEQVTLEDIAALTAAVFVVMEGAPHRIINIAPSRRTSWVTQGRLAHHGSHSPSR